jgi:RNA-directed DNA polymerase
MSANVTASPTDWRSIDWGKANRAVQNLRRRIFWASRDGDLKKARSLQKLMLRSQANRLVSVRRVTQVNKGRNTAGVDKVIVKTPTARGKLVDALSSYTPWKAKPAKRVYIPKSNAKLRPLGIPVVTDRCLQAMVKNALEPFWEARFEATSYGFRPGRSCHDAIEKIFGFVRPTRGKKVWILDADIAGAFDGICHQFLLDTIGNFSARELIKQWLKAGYLERAEFHPTGSGTPQGGVVSPILMNVALHGMEAALTEMRYSQKFRRMVRYGTVKRGFVRYADDFVVLCETREDAEKCRGILDRWLEPRGLRLSEEKTRIVHITEGFDFLGFNIRRYPAPKTTRSGFKLIIKPSKASVTKLRRRLRAEWRALRGHRPHDVVTRLNPIIRGWANYFRTSCASRTFHALDRWMFRRELKYVRHRHPRKPRYWYKPKYWRRFNLKRQDYGVFGDKETGAHIQRFSWFPIERHIMVRGSASPDDPNLQRYWATRQSREAKNLRPAECRLAIRQKGLCPRCGETLFNGEELHTHHVVPKKDGGSDTPSNLRLLHYYCHQQVHARRGRHSKDAREKG